MPPTRYAPSLLAAFAFLLATGLGAANAQDTAKLRVGVIDLPPYAMKTSDDVWLGYAVDAWRIISEKNNWAYDLRPIESGEVEAAVAGDQVDVVLPVIATPELAEKLDLSLPLHTATIGVATKHPSLVLSVARGFLTLDFLRLCIGMSILLLGVGALVWVFERKRNGRQFSKHVARGLGDGFWFAGVTLTTIGYGDKTPITLAGRTVAMLWMVIGLAVSSALTASIVTLADIGRNEASAALRSGEVGAQDGSTTSRFLNESGYLVKPYPTLAHAVDALEKGDVKQIAGLAPALIHETADTILPLNVTDSDPVFVTIALKPGSDLLKSLDVSILEFNNSEAGEHLRETYLKK